MTSVKITDYIKVIAEHLSAETPVVLYTAATETFSVIKQSTNTWTLDKFIALINELRKPDMEQSFCKKCILMKNNWFPADYKVQMIAYGEDGVCNFNCRYCTLNANFRAYNSIKTQLSAPNKRNAEGITTLLRALKTKSLLHPQWAIGFASGEPALVKNFQELFDASAEYDTRWYLIHTNGSIYNETLFNWANNHPVQFITSIDAGSAETFKKLRSIDAFDKVRENLKRYAKANMGMVTLKYIFCPGVNDNEKDIDGFAAFFDEFDAPVAQLTYDKLGKLPVPDKTAC